MTKKECRDKAQPTLVTADSFEVTTIGIHDFDVTLSGDPLKPLGIVSVAHNNLVDLCRGR